MDGSFASIFVLLPLAVLGLAFAFVLVGVVTGLIIDAAKEGRDARRLRRAAALAVEAELDT